MQMEQKSAHASGDLGWMDGWMDGYRILTCPVIVEKRCEKCDTLAWQRDSSKTTIGYVREIFWEAESGIASVRCSGGIASVR